MKRLRFTFSFELYFLLILPLLLSPVGEARGSLPPRIGPSQFSNSLAPESQVGEEDSPHESGLYALLPKAEPETKENVTASLNVEVDPRGEIHVDVLPGDIWEGEGRIENPPADSIRGIWKGHAWKEPKPSSLHYLTLMPPINPSRYLEAKGVENYSDELYLFHLRNDWILIANFLIRQGGFPSETPIGLVDKAKAITIADRLILKMAEEISRGWTLAGLSSLPLFSSPNEAAEMILEKKRTKDVHTPVRKPPVIERVSTVTAAEPSSERRDEEGVSDEGGTKEATATSSELREAIEELYNLERREELTPAQFNRVLLSHKLIGEPQRTRVFVYLIFLQHLESGGAPVSLRDLIQPREIQPREKKRAGTGFLSKVFGKAERVAGAKAERPVDSLIESFGLDEATFLAEVQKLSQGIIPAELEALFGPYLARERSGETYL